MEKIKLLEIDIDAESLIKKGAEARKQLEYLKTEAKFFQSAIKEGNTLIESYTDELAQLEKQGKKNTKEYSIMQKNLEAVKKKQNENRQSLEVLNSEIRKQNKEYRLTQKQIDVYNKTVEKELDIITKTDGSIEQLNQALAQNRKIYRSLSKEQRENTEIGGKLFGLIQKQDREYKELQKSIGTTQVEVGNYKEQIKEALRESSAFSTQLDAQIAQIPVLGTALGFTTKYIRGYAKGQLQAAAATKGTAKSLKIFKVALLGTGIGAILVLLGSLVAYLTSTQDGINKINKVLIPLKTIFQSLLGLAQNFGKAIVDSFSKPKKLIKDLSDTFLENLKNKLSGIKQIAEGLFTFNPKKIKEGFNTATKLEREVLGKIKNSATAIKETIDEAAKRGLQIAEIQQKLSAGEADFIKKVAEGKEQFKAQNKIAEDQTKTLKEREAAALKSIQILKETNQAQRERNALELQLLELKAASNDTSDADRAEIARKIAELKEANAALLEAETTQQNKLNAIRKEATNKAIAEAKKRVDAEIKAAEVALERYILENNKVNSTLQERITLYQTALNKETEILKKQLEARKITQQEYELAVLQKKQEYTEKINQATIENLQTELDLYIAQNRSKIEEDEKLTQELVANEQSRLEEIYQRRVEILEEQRENELISEQDFLLRKLELQYNFLEQKKELDRQYKEQQKEVEQFEYETEFETRRLRGESEFQLKKERLEREYQAELEKAQKIGADTSKVDEKYASLRANIKEQETQAKFQAQQDLLGGISKLLGEETAAGKAAAIAQATMNTYQGVTQVWRAPSVLPEPFGTAQKVVSTGIVLGSGLSAVKKIVSTKAKFQDGGYLEGKSHAQGGIPFTVQGQPGFEAEGGEFIVNKKATAVYRPLLEHINNKYKIGKSSPGLFSNGGIVSRSLQTINTTRPAIKIDTDTLAAKIGDRVSEANRQLPRPVVTVEDINTGQIDYAQVVSGANL